MAALLDTSACLNIPAPLAQLSRTTPLPALTCWPARLCLTFSACRAAPDAKLNDIKALLGKMLFSGAGMEKRVCGVAMVPGEGAVGGAGCRMLSVAGSRPDS